MGLAVSQEQAQLLLALARTACATNPSDAVSLSSLVTRRSNTKDCIGDILNQLLDTIT